MGVAVASTGSGARLGLQVTSGGGAAGGGGGRRRERVMAEFPGFSSTSSPAFPGTEQTPPWVPTFVSPREQLNGSPAWARISTGRPPLSGSLTLLRPSITNSSGSLKVSGKGRRNRPRRDFSDLRVVFIT